MKNPIEKIFFFKKYSNIRKYSKLNTPFFHHVIKDNSNIPIEIIKKLSISIHKFSINVCQLSNEYISINLGFFSVDNHHLAFYHRARAYFALEKYDDSLNDSLHVITLRPLWNKVNIYSIILSNLLF